jgi:diaminopimelate decarboxylase
MTVWESESELAPETPAFVIDGEVLDGFVDRFAAALARHWPHSILSYSFKTNSLPWLISYMRERGVWAEVVSDAEYELALALGYGAEQIVYNGPIKGRPRLREALRSGSVVNLDSKREVTWTAELARELPDVAIAVGLRVNWDLEALRPGESTTGEEGSRFGFGVDNGELDAAIEELTAAGVRIAGLHRNSATQSLGVYEASATVAAGIVTSRGLDLDWLDIGGGFFGSVDGSPTFADYVSTIRGAVEGVIDPERTRLIVEPGGSLIAVPVEFHASVLDVKQLGGSTFVLTDASRTDVDPLFRRRRGYDVRLRTASTETLPEQIIAGFTCMEEDRITRLRDAPALAVGDRLVLSTVGAYTMSYQSTFIEFLPAVHVRRAGTFTQVRRRWGVADYLRGNRWLQGGELAEHPAPQA